MKIDVYDFLSSTYIFGHLPSEAIEFLASESKEVNLASGEYLVHQDEMASEVYVLCYGRLMVSLESGDTSRFLGEIYPRETVGEMALLGEKRRSSSVIAVRNSTVLAISMDAFERAIHSYPEIGIKLAQLIVIRAQKSMRDVSQAKIIKTITVIPTNNSSEMSDFSRLLEENLKINHRVIRITKDFVKNSDLDYHHPQSENVIKFFSKYEDEYDFVIYDCAGADYAWQHLCIFEADSVLILDDHRASMHAETLQKMGFPFTEFHAPIYLICMHESYGEIDIMPLHPSVTRVNHVVLSIPKTLDRFVRSITGLSLGLLLGGGGARGYAHIGVLRALEEYDISVDVIAGVSSGAIIAAHHALGLTAAQILEVNKETAAMADKFWKYPSVPFVSIYSNKKFKRYLNDYFKDKRIENLWMQYFSISCDLSLHKLHLHERGFIRDAIYASNAVVPMFTPALLNGHLYVDGGFINNVPGDVMRERCNGMILGVDVAKQEHLFVNHHWVDYPSNMQILWSKINPFGKKIIAPGMLELMVRSIELGRESNIKNTEKLFDYYFVPPVENFGVVEYSRIEELEEVGYQYAQEKIEGWFRSGHTFNQRLRG